MKPLLCFACILGLSCALPAKADVYKCVDPASGRVTYTNSKYGERGCTVLSRETTPVTTVPSATRKASPGAASPSSFPKVDAGTQRSRDGDRRQILETELATERQLLETSKKELAEQEAQRSGNEKNYAKVLERVQPFKDKVELHERNIEAIRKEIGNLK
jgi:hypothetical protein